MMMMTHTHAQIHTHTRTHTQTHTYTYTHLHPPTPPHTHTQYPVYYRRGFIVFFINTVFSKFCALVCVWMHVHACARSWLPIKKMHLHIQTHTNTHTHTHTHTHTRAHTLAHRHRHTLAHSHQLCLSKQPIRSHKHIKQKEIRKLNDKHKQSREEEEGEEKEDSPLIRATRRPWLSTFRIIRRQAHCSKAAPNLHNVSSFCKDEDSCWLGL